MKICLCKNSLFVLLMVALPSVGLSFESIWDPFGPWAQNIDISEAPVFSKSDEVLNHQQIGSPLDLQSRWNKIEATIGTNTDRFNLSAIADLDREATQLLSDWLICYGNDHEQFQKDYLARSLSCGDGSKELTTRLGVLHVNVNALTLKPNEMMIHFTSAGILPEISPLLGQVLNEVFAFSRNVVNELYGFTDLAHIGQTRIIIESHICHNISLGTISPEANAAEKCKKTYPSSVRYFYISRLLYALKFNCSNFGFYPNATFYLFAQYDGAVHKVTIPHPGLLTNQATDNLLAMKTALGRAPKNCWQNSQATLSQILAGKDDPQKIITKINGFVELYAKLHLHYVNF